MSLRISSALAGLLVLVLVPVLGACGGEGTGDADSLLALVPGASSPSDAVASDRLLCAIGPGAELQSGCTLERVAGSGVIVITHPDGGFRRLLRDPASGALTPADGAEPLLAEAGPAGEVRFSLGGDRYRIPAALLNPGTP